MKRKAGQPESAPVRMGGRILIDLSHGAYTSIATALKEYISNSWDAGASNIRVVVHDPSDRAKTIIQIVDDGSGMPREDIENKFFRVGRDRRSEEGPQVATLRGKRFVHGRKGLGKLAGLKLANVLEVVTWTKSEVNGAWLDLREAVGDPNAEPRFHWMTEVSRPSGASATGTVITLRGYNRRKNVEMDELATHLRHWFEFGDAAKVVLEQRSGELFKSVPEATWKIARSELFSKLKTEQRTIEVAWDDVNGPLTRKVKVTWGWLDKSDTNVRSMISVFSRTRALSTEETFDLARGWTNMFGIFKLVAEFHADWLDNLPGADPADIKRESIDWHVHPALEAFREAGSRWLIEVCRAHAGSDVGKGEIRQRTESLINEKPQFATWGPEQKAQLVRMVATYASKRALSTDQLSMLVDLFGFVLENGALINFLQDLKESGKSDIAGFLELASEFSASEIIGLLLVTKNKLQLVRRLQEIVRDPKTLEVPRPGRTDITSFLAENPWVFDPELRVDHFDVTIKRIVLKLDGVEPATLNRLPTEYFRIRPDMVGFWGPTKRPVCIELKRPTHEMTEAEAVRVLRYQAALKKIDGYRDVRITVVSGTFHPTAESLLDSQDAVEMLHYGTLLDRAHRQLDEFIKKLQGGLDRIARPQSASAPSQDDVEDPVPDSTSKPSARKAKSKRRR